ncbi:FAD:protein FMN transferase [Clostridium oceanicum]|uniref:FAD:protein FMN transferase n=1 Tax=Clostridium oceanicum TaxID=1543 RepID=A0ABP3UJH2_9CLOT
MKLNNKKTISACLILLILIISGIFFYNYNLHNTLKEKKQLTKKDSINISESKSGFFLGTYINIKIYGNKDDKIFDNCFSILKNIENKMSVNISSSEISKINKKSNNLEIKVSPETFYVIKKGKDYSKLSKGNFDISIGPLVNLWAINSDNPKVPSKQEIQEALSTISYNDILLNESKNTVKLKKQNMKIDLGGIAKGYAADKLTKYLEKEGIKSAILDLGGNIYALGNNSKDKPWKIGVQAPLEKRGEYLGILNISNKSIVTSGIYERNFIKNNKTYHHILSPFTGYPVENSLISTTIVSNKSIDGDALSTAIFSLGIEDGLKLVESIENIDAILVNDKKEVFTTSGFKENFKVTNTDYKIKN